MAMQDHSILDPNLKPKRDRLQARARSGIIFGLALFVLLQLGLGALVEGWRPELRDPTFEIKYRQLARLLSKHKQPPATVVFLGSSMTASGVDAGKLEEPLAASLGRPVVSYNLGINGNGPLSHLIHMERLLRRGLRPDVVCIEISPLMCDAGQSRLDIERFPANVLERHDLETLERFADPPDLRTEWWQSHLVPIHGHRGMILNQSARALVPFNERVELWSDVDGHGWRPRPVPLPEEHRHFLAEVESEFKARWVRHKVDPVPLAALRDLTALLAKERIMALLVIMPEGPMMRSLYISELAAPVMDEFAKIARQQGFPLIHARDWLDEDMFRDSYHLHADGAKAFTERLLREALTPTIVSLPKANQPQHARTN
jgi:hypothetical protein